MNKIIGKYIASIDYFYKPSIVLSVRTGSSSIASFATVFTALVGIVSANFSLVFSISTGIIKNY